ncbi:hypothetical protein COT42_01705 [Candidatus Saganbacteria bacterium CG08_land_8_20_14_0_20_45_16]|uniref:Uncharacterized protein n=1 Tax=Candidatus Saganbacteria bacterium CG08_land_8_20_14_0_20_45_16 TaxID=2014293 RepID=A0A2H0Y0Z3_UNCSA|nr:MAG: hypothetical protein COT42_01705 [Candidatus Saganbacteria bacterium CG08_land_8_20_14_0_20_45_16]
MKFSIHPMSLVTIMLELRARSLLLAIIITGMPELRAHTKPCWLIQGTPVGALVLMAEQSFQA